MLGHRGERTCRLTVGNNKSIAGSARCSPCVDTSGRPRCPYLAHICVNCYGYYQIKLIIYYTLTW